MFHLPSRTNASVPTPPAGYVALFFSSDLNKPAYKDDTGTVSSLVGATGSPGGAGPPGPVVLLPPEFGYGGEDVEPFVIPSAAAPASSGSSTVLYKDFDPKKPDASPHSLSTNFQNNDLSAFTKVHDGDAGVVIDADTTVAGHLFIEAPTHEYKFRALLKAFPGGFTDFTIHSAVSILSQANDGLRAGIVVTDASTSGNGSQHCVNIGGSGPWNREILTWQKFGTDATGAGVAVSRFWYGSTLHLAIRRVSGTVYNGYSYDGKAWDWIQQALYNGITPTHFGVFLQNYSDITTQAVFPYLRYYDVGTQLRTGGSVNVLS